MLPFSSKKYKKSTKFTKNEINTNNNKVPGQDFYIYFMLDSKGDNHRNLEGSRKKAEK